MPALAPDGSRVAFASNRNGNWDIYVMPIGGGAPTQLTADSDEEVQPTWAPDGRRIAFSRKNGRTNTWEIWIVDTQNPGLRAYVCEGFLPRWSPEEKKDVLLFQRARQRGSRLYGVWTIELVKGEGLSPTEIVSARNAAVLQPSWSPDGSKIVFTSVVNPSGDTEWPEQSDIWIINADGTGRIGLTKGRFRNMQPTWGADGRIYFVSNRGGIENIWSIAADGGQDAAGSVEFAAETRKKNRDFAENGTAMPANNAAVRTTADGTPDLLRSFDE
jgi:TolB protein